MICVLQPNMSQSHNIHTHTHRFLVTDLATLAGSCVEDFKLQVLKCSSDVLFTWPQGPGKILESRRFAARAIQADTHTRSLPTFLSFNIIQGALGRDSQNQKRQKRVRFCLPQNGKTGACQKNGPLATSLPRACQALATSLPSHWPPRAKTLNGPTPCHAACHATPHPPKLSRSS